MQEHEFQGCQQFDGGQITAKLSCPGQGPGSKTQRTKKKKNVYKYMSRQGDAHDKATCYNHPFTCGLYCEVLSFCSLGTFWFNQFTGHEIPQCGLEVNLGQDSHPTVRF